MRLTYRAAGLLALAVAAITCTDAPTGPGHRAGFNSARLALAPSFSPSAARAYGALEAIGITVTQVRIRLRTTDGTLARDTTIQFGAEDTLHLQLPVEIQGTEQTFSALIELLDANGAVLFSQTQDVTARASTLPAAPPPTITLEYVGPGATARSLSITPADLTVQPGVEPVLTAVGTDAAGGPVTNLLVAWTSGDPTIATVTAIGPVATVHGTGRRGPVTITATLPTGVAGTTRLTMLPVAARLVVISGAEQTDMAGRTLAQPLVVELQGVDGGPIPGATVSFRALTTGAVGTATAVTDAAGRASTTLTLGRVAGTQIFEATAATLVSVSVNTIATPIQAVALAVVSGNGQVDSTGAAGRGLAVRATDEFGAPVAGVSILWERLAGTGLLGATSSTTDAEGIAGSAYEFGALAGVDTLRATIAGATGASASALFTATAITRGPNAIAITSGGGQSGPLGTLLPLPLVAVVTDALGHRLAGLTVQWQSSVAGLLTFATPVAPTDANGEVRTTATLGTVAGVSTVTASVGALSASTTIGASVGAAVKLGILQAAPASMTVGVAPPAPVKVRLDDASGNAVNAAGVLLTATLTLPPSTTPVSVTTALTDDAGIATLSLPAYVGTIGTGVLTITGAGLTSSVSNPITIVAGAPALLRVVAPPTSPTPVVVSGLPFVSSPVVQVTDAGANALTAAGIVVSVSVGSGAAVLATALPVSTDANGRATFAGLLLTGVPSQVSLLFSATGLAPASLALDLTADTTPIAQLLFAGANGRPIQVRSGIVMAPVQLQLAGADNAPVRRAGDVVTATVAIDPEYVGGDFRTAAQVRAQRLPSALRPLPLASPGVQLRAPTSRSSSLTAPITRLAAATEVVLPLNGPVVIGTVTAVTDVNGIATFDGLAVAGLRDSTPYVQLSFATPAVTAPAVASVRLLGGNAKQVIQQIDATPAVAGALVDYLPYARVVDSLGNGVDGLSVAFSAVGTSNGTPTTSTDGTEITYDGYVWPASWRLPAGQKIDSARITVVGLTLPDAYLTVRALKPSFLSIAPMGQTTFVNGLSGTQIPLSVNVLDSLKAEVVPVYGIPLHAMTDSAGRVTHGALNGADAVTSYGTAYFYPLTFNTDVGVHRIRVTTGVDYTGPLIESDSTPLLSVTAAVGTALSITPVNGTEFSAIAPAASLSQPVAARILDAQGQPVSGAQLLLQIPFTGSCTFADGSRALNVNASGDGTAEFNVDLTPFAATGGGCTVWAWSGFGGAAQTQNPLLVYRIAVAPTPQHRVWWGDATQSGGDWTLPANWRSTSYPVAGEKVFVPMWNGVQSPTVSVDAEIGEVALDQYAQVVVGATATLRVKDALTGPATSSVGGTGTLTLTGDATLVTVPSLTNLTVGESSGCGARALPLTGQLYVQALVVNCPLAIGGLLTASGSMASANRGRVEIASPGAMLSVGGDASFDGDSLIISAGSLLVSRTATFAGRGGRFTGGSVYVQGDATFGGSGRGGYELTNGILQLDGALTQKRSDTASTFVASGEHLTVFTGSVLQKVSFEDAFASHFGRVTFANRTLEAGVLIPAGAFASALVSAQVQPNTTLTIDGDFVGSTPVQLLGGSMLKVNGRLLSGCSGATLLPLPIVSGSGTIGGQGLPAVIGSCAP